jgi:hypothetical protein
VVLLMLLAIDPFQMGQQRGWKVSIRLRIDEDTKLSEKIAVYVPRAHIENNDVVMPKAAAEYANSVESLAVSTYWAVVSTFTRLLWTCLLLLDSHIFVSHSARPWRANPSTNQRVGGQLAWYSFLPTLTPTQPCHHRQRPHHRRRR